MTKTNALFSTLFFLAAVFGQKDTAPSAQSDVGKYSTQTPLNIHFAYCRGDSADSADCVVPPRQTDAPKPKFPRTEHGHAGTVKVALIVGTDGAPQSVHVYVSVSPAFDAAALDVVKKWKFAPATYHGRPVKVPVVVEVEFHQ